MAPPAPSSPLTTSQHCGDAGQGQQQRRTPTKSHFPSGCRGGRRLEEVENSSEAPRPAGAVGSWMPHEAWHEGKGNKGKAPRVQPPVFGGGISASPGWGQPKGCCGSLCASASRLGGSGGRRAAWHILTSTADVLIFRLFLVGSPALPFHT